jgi:hypothetical protein
LRALIFIPGRSEEAAPTAGGKRQGDDFAAPPQAMPHVASGEPGPQAIAAQRFVHTGCDSLNVF